VRRALLAAALALLLVVDILSAPLAMVIITQGRALSHGGWLRASLFFLLVAAVLMWLTSVVVTALRKPTSEPTT
jgi:hypothetical protein